MTALLAQIVVPLLVAVLNAAVAVRVARASQPRPRRLPPLATPAGAGAHAREARCPAISPAVDSRQSKAALPRRHDRTGRGMRVWVELPPEWAPGQAILAAWIRAGYQVTERRLLGIGERRMVVQGAPGLATAPAGDSGPIPPRDAEETFPPDGARHVRPHHPDVWARLAGKWRPAILITWLWRRDDPAALLEWRADPAESETVRGVYRYEAAVITYRASDIPPDRWRWTCTPAEAARLLPPPKGSRSGYRPWPACPGCGAHVDRAYPADSPMTALIVLPCGQRLQIRDAPT